MSKHQSNIVDIPAAQLLPESQKINEIATSVGLVKRQSQKFNPFAFLLVCIKASVSESGTLEQLASSLSKTTKSAMSRSAMYQRFHSDTLRFFATILYEVLGKKFDPKQKIQKRKLFNRIITQDSTHFKMHAKNHEEFPAHGNGKSATAGGKVDFTFDLLTNQVIETSLHHATQQDKEIGKQTLSYVERNDLVLRDMGYFIISEFTEIEKLDAYWLSRLPANVNAYVKSGKKQISLEQRLSKSKRKSLNLVAYIGKKERKKVRLVAVRVDEAALAKRRRERKASDSKCKKSSTSDMKQRDHWHLMVTNIEDDKMNINELAELYRLRWKIELSFKAWKQSGQIETTLARKSNPYYLESMLVAGMIRFILSFQLYKLIEGVERLSMDKLFKKFCSWIKELTDVGNLSKVKTFVEDIRHIQSDLRKRSSLEDILDEIFMDVLA